MKGWKSILSMSAAIGMLLYAVPRLDVGGGISQSTMFSIVWILLALLIIAAHLHELLGVDQETRRQIARINQLKRLQLEQRLAGRSRLLQLKK